MITAGLSALFLPYCAPNGDSSVLEVHSVEPNTPRSWFNGGEVIEGVYMSESSICINIDSLQDGRLLIMTPIDPVLLLVPLLRASSTVSSICVFIVFRSS